MGEDWRQPVVKGKRRQKITISFANGKLGHQRSKISRKLFALGDIDKCCKNYSSYGFLVSMQITSFEIVKRKRREWNIGWKERRGDKKRTVTKRIFSVMHFSKLCEVLFCYLNFSISILFSLLNVKYLNEMSMIVLKSKCVWEAKSLFRETKEWDFLW